MKKWPQYKLEDCVNLTEEQQLALLGVAGGTITFETDEEYQRWLQTQR